jgi:alkylhydroperoxidase family enzyme
MPTYLPPIDKPKGLMLKLLYRILGRQFGKVPSWLNVWSARMPFAYTKWTGTVAKLNKQLQLPQDTMRLIRACVDNINGCTWCADAGRWYELTKSPHNVPKLDAVNDYQANPLFSNKERAALEFATELTDNKHVSPETFATLSKYYSEREICEIVWIVSTNHLFNINNFGLGIGSDGSCDLIPERAGKKIRAATA